MSLIHYMNLFEHCDFPSYKLFIIVLHKNLDDSINVDDSLQSCLILLSGLRRILINIKPFKSIFKFRR